MIVSIFFLCRFIFSSQKLSWGKKCGIFRMECVNLRRERVTGRVKNQVRSVCVRCGRRRRLSACRAGMWQPERAAGNASKLPKNGSAPKLWRETLVVCELIHIRERAPSVALRGCGARRRVRTRPLGLGGRGGAFGRPAPGGATEGLPFMHAPVYAAQFIFA